LIFNGKELNQIIQSEIPDFVFTSNNVVNNVLTINGITPIADICFYTNNNQTECEMVHLPLSIQNNTTLISFQDVKLSDYQYGGVVKFAKGTVYVGDDD
jgi:hypothetical protein